MSDWTAERVREELRSAQVLPWSPRVVLPLQPIPGTETVDHRHRIRRGWSLAARMLWEAFNAMGGPPDSNGELDCTVGHWVPEAFRRTAAARFAGLTEHAESGQWLLCENREWAVAAEGDPLTVRWRSSTDPVSSIRESGPREVRYLEVRFPDDSAVGVKMDAPDRALIVRTHHSAAL
ncbi:hypothetical protein HUO13_35545 [Saccharopolyspora erythraea]|uniref:hypothetical protein n=1 Tax=Saccharopolyspora erythraea TaxID=1836 RepID=UPI001BAAA49C|nr:hypothetical protein [Saccharopolyspora erythraea]QUH05390.1 hypothetical protein HUO13_35545 [Saccharopolyspora erythraea]